MFGIPTTKLNVLVTASVVVVAFVAVVAVDVCFGFFSFKLLAG